MLSSLSVVFSDTSYNRGLLRSSLTQFCYLNNTQVKQLDTDLGGAVNDMAMMLGVVQMRMQQRTYESVEKIADAMEASKSNGGSGGDAEAMAQAVAQAAGMSREEASQELGDLKNVRGVCARR